MTDQPNAKNAQTLKDMDWSRRLVEWYWEGGYGRGKRPTEDAEWEGNYEQFTLPTGTWLRQLYEVRDGLQTVEDASNRPRRSVALWGMSQTGKSTSVSALIDANVQVSEAKPDTDGSGGGLHWQGGLPFFFVAPFRDESTGATYPKHWYGRSLNPFTLGIDASSCLSRFVPGSLTAQAGCVQVTDPMHPVEVHLVPPPDLLHALARGFDSECLGSGLNGKPQEWTPERFDRMLAEFRDERRAMAGKKPNREAYERMLAVVSTLKDLVFARLETFDKLRTNEADWQSRLESLLNDGLLIGDPEVADAFAAQLFWNGSPEFTARFVEMRAVYNQLTSGWGKRPVFASLPVTSLLLDMSSCSYAFLPSQGAETREGQQQERIRSLGFKQNADRILLGCGNDYPEKLGANAMAYSNFQGLVWELVIPINIGNLKPGPFRELLTMADVLDFPGVGRDEKNETNRINANAAQLGNGKGRAYSDKAFFSDIVKRGKTASIVATYSRRLTVDSFSILQNIDKDDPKNNATDQIANGIRTWLRNMAPSFVEGAGRRPPGVSLNLGLTFWGELVQQGSADKAANFETRRKFYDKLGVISDPDVSTVFALNYHWIRGPRVQFNKPFKKGSPLYNRITEEPEFQRVFKNPISRQSVDEMADDLDRNGSGGADFLFSQLRTQVEGNSGPERSALFKPLADRQREAFASLIGWRHLRKPHSEADTRVEELDAFVARLKAALNRKGEADVRAASHALRELLNINPDSLSLPATGREGLTSAEVEKWYNEWKSRQVQRYDDWARRGGKGIPDWSRIGVRDRDDISRMLEALITSLGRTTYNEIAALAQRCWDTVPGRDDHRYHHLRRYIAIEMTNRLLYKSPEKSTRAAVAPPPARTGEAEPTGTATRTYATFIGPFVEQQLGAIKRHLTPVVLRPPLMGDEGLEKILGSA